ncbi:hypothetical protein POM88_030935 [Heracleum sosnowskyi]|uniref:Uncharacterized protein n=1 Tax=Heracleum sosnowskyi TaxID=360622 RepID=A0AAD8HYD8_9APIA|nr:hypothetical protein POM88_030935 [Heracleum sosnowskyi]
MQSSKLILLFLVSLHSPSLLITSTGNISYPTSAMMYATRATVYIKMKKSNAAIRDVNAALEINHDSAKGHKSRGMALAMLGQWKEAANDLHKAYEVDDSDEDDCDEDDIDEVEEVEEKHNTVYEEGETINDPPHRSEENHQAKGKAMGAVSEDGVLVSEFLCDSSLLS